MDDNRPLRYNKENNSKIPTIISKTMSKSLGGIRKTPNVDKLGIWHQEEYRLEHDFTPRMKRAKVVAEKVLVLDAKAENYIRTYRKKRNQLIQKMRNII